MQYVYVIESHGIIRGVYANLESAKNAVNVPPSIRWELIDSVWFASIGSGIRIYVEPVR